MRHSRGRGRGGRARGRGPERVAPKLPFKLRQELDVGSAGPKAHKGSGSMFAVSRRKEERKAARHRGRGRSTGAVGGRHSKDFKHFSSRPEPAQESRPKVGSKRPAERGAEGPVVQKKTKFPELLGHAGPQATSKEAFEAEAAFQRQLAKKLGIKGKKRKAAAPPEKEAAEELDAMFAADGAAAVEGSATEDEPGSEAPSSEGYERDSLMGGLSSSGDEEQDDIDGEGTNASEDEESSGTEGDEDVMWESDGELEGVSDRGRREGKGVPKDPGKLDQPAASSQRYVPPAVRRAANDSVQGASERLIKRVKGLLNRLAEANVQPSIEEAAGLLESEGRRPAMSALTQELLQAVAGGPRATDRFAAVTAAFVSGLAGTTRAAEVTAFFLEAAAARMEAAMKSEDSLAAGNVVAVIAHLYGCKAIDAATVYSLLEHLQSRFSEQDVALVFTLLSIAGFQLRSDDPHAMKDFVQSTHSRVAEASGKGNLSTRAQVLLGLVLDIKNNRQRSQGTGGPLTISAVLSAGVLKWLRTSGIDEVQLRNLSWQQVLQPTKKPTAGSMKAQTGALAASAAAEGEGGAELLRLAAAQRMSTEARRAVFCVVMGAQDAADACERLLRLPLKVCSYLLSANPLRKSMSMSTEARCVVFCLVMGAQDATDACERLLCLALKGEAQRELVRVTVECCLQERAWNGYYAQLLGSLVRAGKGHRITLQFALWDLIKLLEEGNARRMINLARLIATLIASKAIPITVLKVVDFADVMTARHLLFWRIVFEELLQTLDADSAVQEVFSKFGSPGGALSAERADLTAFLRRQIGPWLAGKHTEDDVLLGKLRAAEMGLSAAANEL